MRFPDCEVPEGDLRRIGDERTGPFEVFLLFESILLVGVPGLLRLHLLKHCQLPIVKDTVAIGIVLLFIRLLHLNNFIKCNSQPNLNLKK